MIIYFVRHGHPDYKNDCLTDLGIKQAEAVALRLQSSNIESVFASTRGRALQTAQYTAKALGLDVIPCDFMREIGWGSINGEPILEDGHPWLIPKVFASEGRSLRDTDWREKDPFSNNKVVKCTETVITGFDAWLEGLGYKREGEYYRVITENTDKTVAMFSHGGASAVAFSHMFGIPFPQMCGVLHIDFTGVTVVRFSGSQGDLILPKLISSDANHIRKLDN